MIEVGSNLGRVLICFDLGSRREDCFILVFLVCGLCFYRMDYVKKYAKSCYHAVSALVLSGNGACLGERLSDLVSIFAGRFDLYEDERFSLPFAISRFALSTSVCVWICSHVDSSCDRT